jgi:hypothetical protein
MWEEEGRERTRVPRSLWRHPPLAPNNLKPPTLTLPLKVSITSHGTTGWDQAFITWVFGICCRSKLQQLPSHSSHDPRLSIVGLLSVSKDKSFKKRNMCVCICFHSLWTNRGQNVPRKQYLLQRLINPLLVWWTPLHYSTLELLFLLFFIFKCLSSVLLLSCIPTPIKLILRNQFQFWMW